MSGGEPHGNYDLEVKGRDILVGRLSSQILLYDSSRHILPSVNVTHSSQPFAHPSLGKCFFPLADPPPSTQWNATHLSQPIRQQRTCFCDHRSSSHTSLADFQLSLTISISFINWSSTHLTRTLEVRLYIFPSPLQTMASSRPGYRNEPLIATSHPLQTDQRCRSFLLPLSHRV